MCDMNYIRFTIKDSNKLFSDILGDSCVLYIHNKILRERNGFLLKGDLVYVNTLYGLLSVNMENNCRNTISGSEKIILTHHMPNLRAINKCENVWIFKVGKRYIKVSDKNEITLTLFRKLATEFVSKPIKIIECDSNSQCLYRFLMFDWLKKLF